MPDRWIALGGNLGSVRQTFADALDLLSATPRVSVRAVSTIHQTRPVGADAGADYTNAAAELETDLAPLELLDLLQSIEDRLGRVRTTHWGPRTLDLDLLLYGQEIIDLPRLRVPHPHLWYRRFVLDPLVEVAPQVVHPEKGLTIEQLRSRLLPRPLTCALAGRSAEFRAKLSREVAPQFPEVEFREHRSRPDTSGETSPASAPALVIWLGPARGEIEPHKRSPLERSTSEEFLALPLIPRLDIALAGGPTVASLQSVLRAALG